MHKYTCIIILIFVFFVMGGWGDGGLGGGDLKFNLVW